MNISFKEASKIIFNALSLWDELSNNPGSCSAMTDHCHVEYEEAYAVAKKLSEMEGQIDNIFSS